MTGPEQVPDEIRRLLRECAVVIRPGETLVLRVPDDMTPMQAREYMDALDALIEYKGWGFSVLPVMAKELAVVSREVDASFDERVAEAIGSEPVRAAIRHQRNREAMTNRSMR